jgi:hypothetical protein
VPPETQVLEVLLKVMPELQLQLVPDRVALAMQVKQLWAVSVPVAEQVAQVP